MLLSLLLSGNQADTGPKISFFLKSSLPANLFISKLDESASVGMNEGTNFLWDRCHRSIQSAGPALEKPSLSNSLEPT